MLKEPSCIFYCMPGKCLQIIIILASIFFLSAYYTVGMGVLLLLITTEI